MSFCLVFSYEVSFWLDAMIPYLKERGIGPLSEDEGYQRCCDQRTSKTHGAEPPCLFSFPCPGVDTHHDKNDVEGRQDVKVHEYKVPQIRQRMDPEPVEVSRTEHDGI